MLVLPRDDQVYVDGHQTEAVDDEVEPLRVRFQEAQVGRAVFVDEEDVLARLWRIATLVTWCSAPTATALAIQGMRLP